MEFLGRIIVTVLGGVILWSIACSSQQQHPPQIGDCMGSASACLNAKVGSGSGSPSIADGGSCGALTFREPCQTCAETNCCSLVGLCSKNADCVALAVDCVSQCTTQSCVDDCKAKHPSGAGDLDALDQCLLSSCTVECGPTDAGTSTQGDAGGSVSQSCGRFSYQVVACQNCVENGCCDQAEMCASDPDCFLYFQCIANCSPSDAKCFTDCQTTLPLGFANSTKVEQCIQSRCSAQCR